MDGVICANLGSHMSNLHWKLREQKGWVWAISFEKGRGIWFLEEVWGFPREEQCTCKQNTHQSKLCRQGHLLISCLVDHLQH